MAEYDIDPVALSTAVKAWRDTRDEIHLATIYAKYLRPLCRTVRRAFSEDFCGDSVILEEEAVAACLRALDRWDPHRVVKTTSTFSFLTKVARNKMRDVSRAERRHARRRQLLHNLVMTDPAAAIEMKNMGYAQCTTAD
jgi:DNA-directed RNA polymerase specialized sigma24 family protein